jgi:hypothetical protein
MLAAGGCYQVECRHDRAALVMCVSSEDTTEAPLRIDVYWPHAGVEHGRSFRSMRAFDHDPVRLIVPLDLDCSRRAYRLELSAISDSAQLRDGISSECEEPLRRCGQP